VARTIGLRSNRFEPTNVYFGCSALSNDSVAGTLNVTELTYAQARFRQIL
jgi:hypothetical protein